MRKLAQARTRDPNRSTSIYVHVDVFAGVAGVVGVL